MVTVSLYIALIHNKKTMDFNLGVDPTNDSNTVILDKEKRIVASWGTVQVRDAEGQILVVKDVTKHLKTMEERGGGAAPIHYDRKGGHGNKRVGKTIDQIPWHFEKDGKSIPGVIVVYQIYKNYRIDDEAFELIEKGEINGLSLGGEAYGGGTVCAKDTPSQCAEILKDIENHEWTLARTPVNPLARNITKSQFRKIVDELTVAGYDTGRVINIAKSFVNVREDNIMADDKTTDEVVKEFAKSIDEKLNTFGDRLTSVEKACEDIKKMGYGDKKKDDEDDKDKKDVKKDVPAPASDSTAGAGPPITKEFMKEILSEVFPDMIKTAVSEEIKKVYEGAGTSQTDKPGTGAASIKTEDVKKDGEGDTAALQEPTVGQDPVDIAKTGGKPKKSDMPHPSKGMVKHDENGIPIYG